MLLRLWAFHLPACVLLLFTSPYRRIDCTGAPGYDSGAAYLYQPDEIKICFAAITRASTGDRGSERDASVRVLPPRMTCRLGQEHQSSAGNLCAASTPRVQSPRLSPRVLMRRGVVLGKQHSFRSSVLMSTPEETNMLRDDRRLCNTAWQSSLYSSCDLVPLCSIARRRHRTRA